ncbi:polyprenyl synthetase family protein [Streptomyces sp. HMX112]|uniref:polyprenyl synthetase family protein n=1 Tax=Streptomyces sp. HMX112 TaxID=3390850 RepID=UPI003A8084DC
MRVTEDDLGAPCLARHRHEPVTAQRDDPAVPGGPAPRNGPDVRNDPAVPVLVDDPAVPRAVEAALRAHLDERLAEAATTDPVFAEEVATRLRDAALRGGKRARGQFLWWGWRVSGGSPDGQRAARVLDVAVALELVQVCALAHDDVMDRSPVRRGGPSVHVDFARQHRRAGMRGDAESFGTAGAVLVGDLALSWADDLLTATALAVPEGPRLHAEWRAMRSEMAAGQYLDVRAAAAGETGPDQALRIAALKSALYSVERPLAMGAALAGADPRTTELLRSVGRCAGVAFQLRDDLLGVFGDPRRTGKPADDDLREGRLTYLRAVALRLAEEAGDTPAGRLLRAGGASRVEEAERTRAALEDTGARKVVEEAIGRLVRLGERRLAVLPGDPAATAALARLVRAAGGLDTPGAPPGSGPRRTAPTTSPGRDAAGAPGKDTPPRRDSTPQRETAR